MELSWNELWPVINVLNEICHGLPIYDIETQVGVKYDEAFALMRKISAYETGESDSDIQKEIELNDSEILIVAKCFERVLKEIDEWEFSTRIGISRDEAHKIIEKVVLPR